MSIEASVQLFGWASLALVVLRAVTGLVAAAVHETAFRRQQRRALRAFTAQVPEEVAADHSSDAPWQGKRKFRVVHKTLETPDETVCSIYFAPFDRKPLPAYRPGQFLMLDVPDGAAGNTVRRCYSLSDAPKCVGAQDTYRITVKRLEAPAGAAVGTPAGIASSFLHQLQHGAIVDVHAPQGHFVLDQASERPVVLIAGGVGITPIISMLNWIVQAQPEREVWLFLGMRDRSGDIMHDHIRYLRRTCRNLRSVVFYSRPTRHCRLGVDYDVQGHVSVGFVSRILEGSSFLFYVCGPDAMMRTILGELVHWGVPEQDIAYEAFGTGGTRSAVPAQTPEDRYVDDDATVYVDFARSRKRVRWTSAAGNLLELAEQNGINARYGCRAGGCGSCETPIIRGEVAYDQQPTVQPKAGTCLTCIARPTSDVVLEI